MIVGLSDMFMNLSDMFDNQYKVRITYHVSCIIRKISTYMILDAPSQRMK
jgi:hypothetical protein